MSPWLGGLGDHPLCYLTLNKLSYLTLLACTHATLMHRILKVKVKDQDLVLILQHWLKNSHLINTPEANGMLILPPLFISAMCLWVFKST